jgi:hypothetical protein
VLVYQQKWKKNFKNRRRRGRWKLAPNNVLFLPINYSWITKKVDEIIKIQKSFKILTDLKFAILILGLLALGSSLGSFIEQEESIQFYEENYANKIYGIIDSKLILTFGLDHVYTGGSYLYSFSYLIN